MLNEEIIDRVSREKSTVKPESIAIPSGAELLDLIIGGGGYGPVGKIVNIIGDSSTGKSFYTCEAIYQAKKIYGDKLKVRYNDAESGFNFNTEELYGYSMLPYVTQTPTIEEFAADLNQFCTTVNAKKDEVGIYVVDSFDGLGSDSDIEEFEERLEAHEKGKEYKKKSYDMGKQKFSSKLFRTLSQTVEQSNVLLIIISQIRDNIGVSFGQKWTISGGNALKFYSTIRLFLRVCDKDIRENRQVGQTIECTGMKVRSKYPYRKVHVNLLFETGIDAVATHIDYLYDLREDYGKLKDASVTNNIAWKEETQEVNSKTIREFLETIGRYEEMEEEFKDNGTRKTQGNLIDWVKARPEVQAQFIEHFGVMDRESLIEYVYEQGLEEEIAQKAVAKWLAVEERIKPRRPKKTLE